MLPDRHLGLKGVDQGPRGLERRTSVGGGRRDDHRDVAHDERPKATDYGSYSFVTAWVDSTTKAGYFPGAQPIRVKMIAERRSGRLLGAQVVGREEAAKRIDALAICIWNEMTVDEILSLDLAYAPPFSPVWDPVLIAARKAFEAVEADVRDL